VPVPLPTREDLLNPSLRHLFVFAHQDDEVLCAGLIQRVSSRGNSRFIWVTNGDGLAPEVGADPGEYARLREKECVEVLNRLGIRRDRAEFLGFSEIYIYDMFVEICQKSGKTPDALKFFRRMADDVGKSVSNASPDVVWTVAFQGGHPEHDLTHILTAKSLMKLGEKKGSRPPLVHFPEYEWTILIPARFRPGYSGKVYDIHLSEEEISGKRRVIEAYPSQTGLFAKFEKVINSLGKLAGIVGRRFTAEDFLRREVFSPVPPDKDYTVCPQPLNALAYIAERHKGVRVTFDRSIRPIIQDLFSS